MIKLKKTTELATTLSRELLDDVVLSIRIWAKELKRISKIQKELKPHKIQGVEKVPLPVLVIKGEPKIYLTDGLVTVMAFYPTDFKILEFKEEEVKLNSHGFPLFPFIPNADAEYVDIDVLSDYRIVILQYNSFGVNISSFHYNYLDYINEDKRFSIDTLEKFLKSPDNKRCDGVCKINMTYFGSICKAIMGNNKEDGIIIKVGEIKTSPVCFSYVESSNFLLNGIFMPMH